MNLSLKNVVTVNVDRVPVSASVNVGCNIGMIVGATGDGGKYKNLTEVLADYSMTTDEGKAAKVYFEQSPRPQALYIGVLGEKPAGMSDEAHLANFLAEYQDVYGFYLTGTVGSADYAKWVKALEAADHGVLFFDTDNADALTASPETPDEFEVLAEQDLSKYVGVYSTDSYAGAAVMGVAMGRETGKDRSAFNLAYSQLIGIKTEDVTQAQVDALLAKNGNIYVSRGQGYDLLEMGRTGDGTPYDEVMYLDMTKKMIENSVMSVFVGNKSKPPQTDDGMALFVEAVSGACERMRSIGYIAEGVWNGEEIGDLKKGDVIVGGYSVFVDSFMNQSQADREARKAMPIWVALKLAGSIESIVINVVVNL